MILDNVKNTLVFSEFSSENQKKWFNLKAKKVVHNIDTLYCTATTKENYYDNHNFKVYLDSLKNLIDLEPYYIKDHDAFMTNLTFCNYSFCVERKDCFLVFFMARKTIDTVPPIFIQIRSQFLWLNGEYRCLEIVNDFLSSFLQEHHLTIEGIKENRIDYAYHTNYIRNMTTFFDVHKLNSMQVSHFKAWQYYGTFSGDNDTETEYLGIGRRTSNNIFIRIYNKSKEVIAMGYKQFFIDYWHENALISLYDKYVYEKCFLKGNYEYMPLARLEFYNEFGLDNDHKLKISGLLNGDKMEYDDLCSYADFLTPRCTVIVNVEFQTKRKFYYSFGKNIDLLGSVTKSPCDTLNYIYKLLDNKILIHNVLTYDVFRLVDLNDNASRKRDKKTSVFWEIIQNCKLNSPNVDGKLLREYQRKMDIEKLKLRISNSLSMLGLYVDVDGEENVFNDAMNYMSLLNESDVEKALNYKIKKAPSLKGKVDDLKKVEVIKSFGLINKVDGTYLD